MPRDGYSEEDIKRAEWRGTVIQTLDSLNKNQDELRDDVAELRNRLRDCELQLEHLDTIIKIVKATFITAIASIIVSFVQLIISHI